MQSIKEQFFRALFHRSVLQRFVLFLQDLHPIATKLTMENRAPYWFLLIPQAKPYSPIMKITQQQVSLAGNISPTTSIALEMNTDISLSDLRRGTREDTRYLLSGAIWSTLVAPDLSAVPTSPAEHSHPEGAASKEHTLHPTPNPSASEEPHHRIASSRKIM